MAPPLGLGHFNLLSGKVDQVKVSLGTRGGGVLEFCEAVTAGSATTLQDGDLGATEYTLNHFLLNLALSFILSGHKRGIDVTSAVLRKQHQ